MEGVALTSLWVAAIRAEESERDNGLFHDPFARSLAGDEGFSVLRRSEAGDSMRAPVVQVRTRFLDDAIVAAVGRGIRQIAVLAAGMDARAFRLALPLDATLFEVDQPHVLAHKAAKLAGGVPRCNRVTVPIDLRDDWPAALVERGFDRRARTMWLTEGLLPYLPEPVVAPLFARIGALSAPGSELLADVLGRSALESPSMKTRLDFVESLGAPWIFGTDRPESLLAPLGWDVHAELVADVAHRFGRWPFPVRTPRGTPGAPQSFLVRAVKR